MPFVLLRLPPLPLLQQHATVTVPLFRRRPMASVTTKRPRGLLLTHAIHMRGGSMHSCTSTVSSWILSMGKRFRQRILRPGKCCMSRRAAMQRMSSSPLTRRTKLSRPEGGWNSTHRLLPAACCLKPLAHKQRHTQRATRTHAARTHAHTHTPTPPHHHHPTHSITHTHTHTRTHTHARAQPSVGQCRIRPFEPGAGL